MLTGRRAHFVQVYKLDERKRKPRSVDDDFVADVQTRVRSATDALRQGDLPKRPKPLECGGCDYRRYSEAAKL